MKIVTIVGTRPQFIKAAPVSRAIAEHNKVVTSESSLVKEVILHTGQHYDDEMSDVFSRDLELPKHDVNFGESSNGIRPASMTGVKLNQRPRFTVRSKRISNIEPQLRASVKTRLESGRFIQIGGS